MDYLVLVLRLIHIVGGVIWVGSALTLSFFIGPTVDATQEAGQQFMRHLMQRTRFSGVVAAAAILTVLAGIVLYARAASAGPAWQSSGPGIGFGVGAAFALVGLACGMIVGSTSGALARLGGEIRGKPSADQAVKLQSLNKRLSTVGGINVVALTLATVMMAIARYLVF